MRTVRVPFSMAVGLSLAICILAFAPLAQAETIEIQFTGLDLRYDGSKIYDKTSAAGRNNAPAESDLLTTVVFEKNDTVVKTHNTDVFADVLIKGVLNIPAGGGQVQSGNGDTFGLDLFSKTSGDEWHLNLNLDKLDVWYSGFEIAIAATGIASSIPSQSLPAGVPAIDGTQPISLAMVGKLSGVQTSGGFLTAFQASGTGSIAAVPEPASLVGLVMAALGLVALAWVRRKR